MCRFGTSATHTFSSRVPPTNAPSSSLTHDMKHNPNYGHGLAAVAGWSIDGAPAQSRVWPSPYTRIRCRNDFGDIEFNHRPFVVRRKNEWNGNGRFGLWFMAHRALFRNDSSSSVDILARTYLCVLAIKRLCWHIPPDRRMCLCVCESLIIIRFIKIGYAKLPFPI